jgi:uncharacterized protein involved in outer membrane biogenesis
MRFAGNEFWNRASPLLRHSRTRTIAIWLVAIVAGIGILGGLVAPPLLRSKLSSLLTEKLHRPVTIEQIRINPYAMTATIRGFLMKEPHGDQVAVSFEELRLNVQLASVFRRGLVIKEFRLVKPYVSLIRNEDRSYNYQDLIKEFTSGPPAPPGPTPRFSLNNIEVVDGKIDFDDRPEKTKHTVSAIHIGLPFVSSLPSQVDITVRPAFSANVNGAPISINGETKPFTESQESVFRLDIDNLVVAQYLEYSPVELNFKVPSGKLHSRLTASFTHFQNKPPALKISGNLVLQELKMVDKGDAPLLDLPAFAIDLDGLEPLAGKATIKDVKAHGLEIHVQRNRGGEINFANLIEKSGPPADTEPKKPGTPFIYRVAEAAIDAGKVYFSDETPKNAYKTRLDNVQLDVKELTNEPGKKATVNLSLDSDTKEHISHTGELQLTPLLLTGKVEIAALRLGGLSPYYENTFAGEIRDGTLDLSTAYSIDQQNDRTAIKLSELNAAVRNLRLNEPGRRDDLSRLPVLAIKDTTVDLENRSILIGKIEGQNGSGLVRRNADGTLNISRLVKSAPAEPVAAQPVKSEAAPWKFELGQVALDRFKMGFEDLARPTPAKINLSDVSLRADKLSNAKNQRGKITFQTRINEKGVLRLVGSAGINPTRGDFVVESRDVEVLPFQPYLEDQVNFILTGGRLGAKGKLTFDSSGPGPLKLTYGGSAQAAEFAAVEKASSDDLLKFKSLNLDSIEFALEPMHLRIGDITLSDFYSRIIIGPDGKINLQNLTVKKEGADSPPTEAKPATAPPSKAKPAASPAQAAAAPPASEKPVTIGKIALHGGQINFSDFFIKPNYSANLMSVEGTISELKPEAPGDINLQAKLDNAAPVDINGKINPLSQELYLDIVADARDIELSPFTPYSAKYVGYGIEKGKLSFNVKYKLENRKLDAQNQIILNQLTFGEKIESPTATKLPVLLAVALLKDRNGVIDINLPISGSLDEPEFSVGGIILKLILNIITKAVTAPFALLGSLFGGGGGGEELSFVEFDYGRATLTPAAETKLKTLATAMNNRPALKLEISARVDPVNDLEGLRKASIERKVKAQKFKELARRGEAPPSVDDVQVASGEYERYLKAAYGAESFPKPRNVIGLAKDLPVPEMEALMLKYTQVGDDDLRDLGNRRAQIVRDRILASGQVTSDRVFIVASKTSSADDKSKGRSSRVDFSLR